MRIDNAKISSKIVGLIGFLAIIMVVSIAFSLLGMRRISANYADLAERVEPGVAMSIRMSRFISGYDHKGYQLAMEDTVEGNRQVRSEIDAARKTITRLSEEIHKALPEHQRQLDEIDQLMAIAYDACKGPLKAAGDASQPDQSVSAGRRLRDECDPALTRALDRIKAFNEGLIASTAATSAALSAAAHRTELITMAFAAGGLIAAICAGLAVATRGIAQPIERLSGVMERFAGNDLEAEVPGTTRGDELGAMARTVEVFKQNALERRALEARERAEIAEREKRAEIISNLTQAFDGNATRLLGLINTAAGDLKGTAQAMSANAEQTTCQALEVSSAADQASSNVQTVATAAEELASSIREISRQVDQSASVTAAAASDANQANLTVQGLADTSARIGEIVQLINDIASQTNLLALNATIEAARAGEAGKGFAVVAGEVKTLASQTARATDEIGQQIASVQAATTQAVAAIAGIVKRIGEINTIVVGISSAVEEQSAATSEIAHNIQQAAIGTERVSNNIGGVRQAAGETRQASDQVLGASEGLFSQSTHLESEVATFLSGVRLASGA